MQRMLLTIGRLRRRDEGQDLVEYALLAGLIAVVAIATVSQLGNTINTVLWQYIVQTF